MALFEKWGYHWSQRREQNCLVGCHEHSLSLWQVCLKDTEAKRWRCMCSAATSFLFLFARLSRVLQRVVNITVHHFVMFLYSRIKELCGTAGWIFISFLSFLRIRVSVFRFVSFLFSEKYISPPSEELNRTGVQESAIPDADCREHLMSSISLASLSWTAECLFVMNQLIEYTIVAMDRGIKCFLSFLHLSTRFSLFFLIKWWIKHCIINGKATASYGLLFLQLFVYCVKGNDTTQKKFGTLYFLYSIGATTVEIKSVHPYPERKVGDQLSEE